VNFPRIPNGFSNGGGGASRIEVLQAEPHFSTDQNRRPVVMGFIFVIFMRYEVDVYGDRRILNTMRYLMVAILFM
jgi:hypothetical protein